MGLIDFNFIENMTGSSGSWNTLIGAVFGIGVKYGIDLMSKYKERQHIGKAFKYELEALEKSINVHFIEIDYHIELLSKNQNSTLIPKLRKRMKTIMALDKLELIKYFKEDYPDAANEKIHTIYNSLEEIYDAAELVEQTIKDFDRESNDFVYNYSSLMNEFIRSFDSYHLQAKKGKSGTNVKDPVLIFFGEIESKYLKEELSVEKALSNELTMHEEIIRRVPNLPDGNLYTILYNYNFNALAAIANYRGKRGYHASRLITARDIMKRNYEKLYS
jgi:hypothetical protein